MNKVKFYSDGILREAEIPEGYALINHGIVLPDDLVLAVQDSKFISPPMLFIKNVSDCHYVLRKIENLSIK